MIRKKVTVREYGNDFSLIKETVTETSDGSFVDEDDLKTCPTSEASHVGEFECVSYDRFVEDVNNMIPDLTSEDTDKMYKDVKLPQRATKGSAGYDFVLPFPIMLAPGETIKIPTGIRVRIEDGWWLCCVPRSGLGTKYRVQLDNTVGVIDGDYYYSDNEGHIFAQLTNDGKESKTLYLKTGDRFMQAVFVPYGITWSDNVTNKRNGGMGSTGE